MDIAKFEETSSQLKAKRLMGLSKNVGITDPTEGLKDRAKGVFSDLSLDDRNDVAMNQVKRKLEAEGMKADAFIHEEAQRLHHKSDKSEATTVEASVGSAEETSAAAAVSAPTTPVAAAETSTAGAGDEVAVAAAVAAN